jgi:hypothetical protein
MNNLNGGELELAVVRSKDEGPGDKVKTVGFSTDAEIRIIPSIGISADGTGNVESSASENVNESSLETKVHYNITHRLFSPPTYLCNHCTVITSSI